MDRIETPDAESDDLLLAHIAGGDHRAFASLMERYIDRTFGLARRLTGSASDAEDVVQEAFSRVWLNARRWRPGGAKFSTWFYRVTVNLCLDHRRKHQRKAEQALALADELPDPTPGADRRLEAAQDRRLVSDAVAALPDRQRAAIVLTYMNELSNAEVAEILELSVGAVESLLVRARKRLRRHLAPVTAMERSEDAELESVPETA